VGVDVVDFVDVPDDPDLWFVLEETVDESFQVGIAEVIIEHPDRNLEVQVLVRLIPTVFPKPGKKSEGQGISDEWGSMKERYMVCLSGGSDFTCRVGAGAQLEGHYWAREAAAGRPAPVQGPKKRDPKAINQQSKNPFVGCWLRRCLPLVITQFFSSPFQPTQNLRPILVSVLVRDALPERFHVGYRCDTRVNQPYIRRFKALLRWKFCS
jgi:hypothetical protein